jgi:hypothetical protein
MAEFLDDETIAKTKQSRINGLVKGTSFDPETYEYDFSYKAPTNIDEITNLNDLAYFAENKENVEIEAKVIATNGKQFGYKTLNTKQFVETLKNNNKNETKLRESFDSFNDSSSYSHGSDIGQDYVSMLGGPFNKQLYISDYLKMIGVSFQSYHHDPVAKRIVQIMKDFTLGKGFRVDCESKAHLAVWEAFERTNNIQEMLQEISLELSINGETMIWRLPNKQKYITYDIQKGQESPIVFLPRYRIVDPSCIWDICTYPEDIKRVLFYQWVSPTQYQIYTGTDQGKPVPTSKFIMQQIPASEMMHFKVNSTVSEKRGRSDLFPVLGYLKRLRDSINYAIAGDQKNSAWSIDTTIEGSPDDMNNYISEQQSLGTLPPAGSEFVHTAKVKREYLANAGAGGKGQSKSFDWAMSMIAMGSGIPVNYFGSHLSGGQTRASAFVATEPVAKMFESRQMVFETIIKSLAKDLFEQMGLPNEDIEVTFPELITQDRSAKLKDLVLCESRGWLSSERCAEIAAKEMGVTEYIYNEEKLKIDSQEPIMPLTAAPQLGQDQQPSGVNGEDRKNVSDEAGL